MGGRRQTRGRRRNRKQLLNMMGLSYRGREGTAREGEEEMLTL